VFFDAARRAWQLDTQDRELLRWTARTHELGLAIAQSVARMHGGEIEVVVILQPGT
jgi:signal transduction histidine kinase